MIKKNKQVKKLLFNSYFQLISMWFYSNFNRDHLLDGEFNSTSNEYPLDILLVDPAPWKMRNTWKNVMMMSQSHFFMYFLFFVKRDPPKYAKWVLIGCEIEFPIQKVLPIGICVKPHGDKLKIWKNCSFFFFFLQNLMR